MKAYLNGSLGLSHIDEPVKERLIELANYDAEFVLANKPGASKVMIDFLKEQGAKNISVKTYSSRRQRIDNEREENARGFYPSGVELRKVKDLTDDADVLLLVWDGADMRTFTEATEAIPFEDSSVEFYSPYTEKVTQLNRFSDLYPLLPPEKQNRAVGNDIDDHDYAHFLREFLSSREICESVLAQPKHKNTLIKIIAASPKPLEQKLHAFEILARNEDVYRDCLDELCKKFNDGKQEPTYRFAHMFRSRSFKQCAEKIRGALRALDLSQGEVLILGEKSYPDHPDKTDTQFGYDGFAPFLTIDAVKQYIASEWSAYEEGDEDILVWYRLEKWAPWLDGTMGKVYTYTMIKDKLVYFARNYPKESGPLRNMIWLPERSIFSGTQGLSFRMPYKAGDIVKIDCRPFAPLTYACLFDFWGYASGEAATLYRSANGSWEECSFSMLADSAFDLRCEMSPSYRLEKAADIPHEYELLEEVRRFVDGDNSKGEALWKELNSIRSDGWSDKEIRAIIKKLGEKYSDKEDSVTQESVTRIPRPCNS